VAATDPGITRVGGLRVRCATQVSAYSPTVIALAVRAASWSGRRAAEVTADVGGLATPRRQPAHATQPRWLSPPAIATPRCVSVHSGCAGVLHRSSRDQPYPLVKRLLVLAERPPPERKAALSNPAGAPPQSCYQRLLGDPLPRQGSNGDYSTMKSGICRVVLVWYSAYGG
jgi:hypothetical protein